ncbi:MAG: hypothetical protein AAF228_05375 [Pseudomonadota bacterium]
MDDTDISDEKKRELIETLWNIIISFVDLGFGIHPLQQANADSRVNKNSAITKLILDTVKEDQEPESQQKEKGA